MSPERNCSFGESCHVYATKTRSHIAITSSYIVLLIMCEITDTVDISFINSFRCTNRELIKGFHTVMCPIKNQTSDYMFINCLISMTRAQIFIDFHPVVFWDVLPYLVFTNVKKM